ncbi:putative RNA polymerase sigma factor FecI [compost metagenome]
MDALLDGLPPKVRTAFLLSRLDGLGYKEIAAQLGVSLRSVESYMAKAIRHCYFATS